LAGRLRTKKVEKKKKNGGHSNRTFLVKKKGGRVGSEPELS